MKRTLATVFVCLLLATPAWAGFKEGVAAAKLGDWETALSEWRPLAEQGDAKAQYNLGLMYAKGYGVPQHDATAVKWFRKAAEQGLAAAQYNLGVMFFNGQGVPNDYVHALKWFNLAAIQGHKDAVKDRDIIAKRMTPAQIAEAKKQAREWWAAFKMRERK